jgi:hypothetical protein
LKLKTWKKKNVKKSKFWKQKVHLRHKNYAQITWNYTRIMSNYDKFFYQNFSMFINKNLQNLHCLPNLPTTTLSTKTKKNNNKKRDSNWKKCQKQTRNRFALNETGRKAQERWFSDVLPNNKKKPFFFLPPTSISFIKYLCEVAWKVFYSKGQSHKLPIDFEDGKKNKRQNAEGWVNIEG